MTRVVKGFPVIVQYPVDDWEVVGAPRASKKGCAKLCFAGCDQGPRGLAGRLNIAKDIDEAL
eukprot:3274064-Lingulodinium_polyedra.AAC.1